MISFKLFQVFGGFQGCLRRDKKKCDGVPRGTYNKEDLSRVTMGIVAGPPATGILGREKTSSSSDSQHPHGEKSLVA